MRVILKCPGQLPKVGDLADVYAMHDFVGGTLSTFPLLCSDGSSYLIVCNDNFLNDDSLFNMSLAGVQFFGNFFICGVGIVDGEHDFVGLNSSDIFNISYNICWSERDRAVLDLSALDVYFSDSEFEEGC